MPPESERTSAVEAPATEHTPGPWSVFGDSKAYPKRYPGIDSPTISIIVFATEDDHDGGVQGKTLEESQANARLIAAAPDLLAALKETLAHVEDENALRIPANQCTLCCFFRSKIRDAIAKAEGRP